jgi:RHS repeat-associated protein
MKFTGHERDLHAIAGAGDDLDYMHARFCSPVTGRFLTVDPTAASANSKQPQSWNRYTYTIGNPLKFVDPSGAILQFSGTVSAKEQAIKIASSGLFGMVLEINSTGTASLKSTGVEGPPTAEQAAMTEVLSDAINDQKTVNIALTEGSVDVPAGSYELEAIDLTDLAAIGDGEGTNQTSLFAHEVAEQFAKQVHGMTYPNAHAVGIRVEESVSGYSMVGGYAREVAPSGVAAPHSIEVVQTYQGGHGRVEMTIVFVNGNITHVRRVP